MFYYKMIYTPSFEVNKKTIDSIFKIIFNNIKNKQNWTLNLVFLDNKSIKKLNNKYRKINSTTDVLSFHYFENFKNLKKTEIAWEIIFSEKKIISQWKKYKHWPEKEFYKLLIHSILHILWFDHEKQNDFNKMQTQEDQIRTELFEKK